MMIDKMIAEYKEKTNKQNDLFDLFPTFKCNGIGTFKNIKSNRLVYITKAKKYTQFAEWLKKL